MTQIVSNSSALKAALHLQHLPYLSEAQWHKRNQNSDDSEFVSGLFEEHISILREKTDKALSLLGYDAIVFGSGLDAYYHADDRVIPYKPSAHFLHWAPVVAGTGHFLAYDPGQKPCLFFSSADDFWHEPAILDASFFGSSLDYVSVSTLEKSYLEVSNYLKKAGTRSATKKVVYVGPQVRNLPEHFVVNPPELLRVLNFNRSYKSAYETYRLHQANQLALLGHQSAHDAFLAGGSEFEIYVAYLAATQSTEHQLPYQPIIALNSNGNFLHYEKKRFQKNGHSLLIDAGASVFGYGSDITRTYALDLINQNRVESNVPTDVTQEGLDVFNGLLKTMNSLQQKICSRIALGKSFLDLHRETLLEVSQVAIDHGFVRKHSYSPIEALAIGRLFLPHGLGHMLGLQVHDVAGHQTSLTAENIAQGAEDSVVRNTRKMEAGHLFTIEPGFYFSHMLLEKFNVAHPHIKINETLFHKTKVCGGIRIEDNIYLTQSHVINLTRNLLH